MIVEVLALASAVTAQVSSTRIDILSVQGRASEVERVADLAQRCGVKNPLVSYVRGPEFYHHPAEPGAELFIGASDVDKGVRGCLRKRLPVLRRSLQSMTLDLDAL